MAYRDPETGRERDRERFRKRTAERRAAGLCPRCGDRPPTPERSVCEPCGERRRIAGRARDARPGCAEGAAAGLPSRTAGLCGRCGGPTTDGGSRCAPCAVLEAERGSTERKNAASRKRYARRRARGECTDCGAASQGAARCEPCAHRSCERSDHFRGIPVWDPSVTVIEVATGECHGTFDSEADMALCLAFARLSRDQVEVISDASPMATFTGWE